MRAGSSEAVLQAQNGHAVSSEVSELTATLDQESFERPFESIWEHAYIGMALPILELAHVQTLHTCVTLYLQHAYI